MSRRTDTHRPCWDERARSRWPGYDPGRDSPAYRDRSANLPWGGRVDEREARREQQDFAGWDAPFGGKPIGDHEHGPWDRLVQEGRSFFDRTREELSALFRGDDHREGPAAPRGRDDFRGQVGCGAVKGLPDEGIPPSMVRF